MYYVYWFRNFNKTTMTFKTNDTEVRIMVTEKDKPLWKSKTVWTGVAILVIGIFNAYNVDLPYELIYSALSGFGLYAVRDAIKKK